MASARGKSTGPGMIIGREKWEMAPKWVTRWHRYAGAAKRICKRTAGLIVVVGTRRYFPLQLDDVLVIWASQCSHLHLSLYPNRDHINTESWSPQFPYPMKMAIAGEVLFSPWCGLAILSKHIVHTAVLSSAVNDPRTQAQRGSRIKNIVKGGSRATFFFFFFIRPFRMCCHLPPHSGRPNFKVHMSSELFAIHFLCSM